MTHKTGLGQDSHRFLPADASKPCILGGLIFNDAPGFSANSDGDVVLHAICNAISSLTGIRVLGGIADELLEKDGITDSSVYLEAALNLLGKMQIDHLAISIEASRPHFGDLLDNMRAHIAKLMKIETSQVGITATTGEGLTDFGLGDGVQAFCILSVSS